MRFVPLLICAQLVLVPTTLLHAAEVNITSCDHERSRSSREVLQQVKADTSLHLHRFQKVDAGSMCWLQHVLSVATKANYQLTEQCPLRPIRDV